MISGTFLRQMAARLGVSLFLIAVSVEPAESAGLLVADGGFGGQLEIVEQDVQVTINNGIAVTQIDQVFLNKENRIVEALYTFPVPRGASVSNFTMIIGGKEMVGEVVEKQRAREIYESYKSTRRDPGLLEQVDYKTFELQIFPIPAGAEQRINITYYQQLDFDHNAATYVYPLATTAKGALDSTVKGKFAFTLDVKSEVPILKLYSPSHDDDLVVTSVTPSYTRASLELPTGDLSRDVVVTYDTERPSTGIDVVTSNRAGEDGYFMLSMTAGKELEELGGGMDYVFVVDISGSMANDGKLQLSRSAIESFMTALGSEDRFEVMTFNTAPETRFAALTEVNQQSQQRAAAFLKEQRARGGTALRPAVMTAYKYKDADRPLNVVILSDGMTEINEQSELLAAMESAPAGTRVFCIGIGNDINRPLLQQVAENAGGLAAFISHQDDFHRQADAFRRKLMRPVATNVQIEIGGVAADEIADENLPDLYYGSPIWLLGRYRQPGTATITVTAEVLGQPIQETVSIDFPEVDERNPEIERMWAFTRVQRLMGEMRQGGPSKADEIVRLCENYSIVSEYASFIVLENDAEYKRWAIERRNANRVQRDRAAQQRLREQLSQLREESLAKLGPPTQRLVSTTADRAADSGADGFSINATSQPTTSTTPGDLNFAPQRRAPGTIGGGGGGGGGAIDPLSGLIAASLAGASIWAARRRASTSRTQV